MEKIKNKIYVGYDSREVVAYQICEYSLLKMSSNNLNVVPLIQQELRQNKVYTRNIDPLSSTEFTFTRFLIPHLTNYSGWVLFCDCDFLWLTDANELFNLVNNDYAVMVVKHDYKPHNSIKMDNQVQTIYPRKNWSSLILWNCSHPSNKHLTLDVVNNSTGQYLHQFQWLKDEEIGALSYEWNWLVGWNMFGTPKALHYTEGGPYFVKYFNCQYAELWKSMYKDMFGCDFLIQNCVDYK